MSNIDLFARQENEVLKKEKHELQHKIIDLRQSKEELQDKIDKAIDYMQDYCELVVPDANIKSLILKEEYKKIIEILRGKNE